MSFDTRGNGRIVIIFVIVVLAILAYGIMKNKTAIAPTIEETPEQTETTTGVGTTGTQVNGNSQATTNTPSETSSETTELTELENDASLIENDLNDLMFEDLGFE